MKQLYQKLKKHKEKLTKDQKNLNYQKPYLLFHIFCNQRTK